MITRRRISLNSTSDILNARLQARELAIHLGFGGFAVTLIAAAIAKVARHIVGHSRSGEIVLDAVKHGPKSGIQVTAHAVASDTTQSARATLQQIRSRAELDANVDALRDMMDELKVISNPSGDTTLIMKRWRQP